MKTYKVILSALGVLALVSACQKDHDLDDYKTEQFQEYFAKVKVAQALYLGTMIPKQNSPASHGVIAVTSLDITVSPQQNPSSDESSPTMQPIIEATLRIQGFTSILLTTKSASFDPDSHFFTAQFPITPAAGVPSTSPTPTTQTCANTFCLTLSGNIDPDNGTFKGTFQAQGYEAYGANVLLSTNGGTIESLAKKYKPKALPVESRRETYNGTYTFNDSSGGQSVDSPAKLVVVYGTRDSSQALEDIFFPQPDKTLEASLIIFKGKLQVPVPTSFPSVDWNMDRNTLIGSAAQSVTSTTGNTRITCPIFNFPDDTSHYNFQCTFDQGLTGNRGTASFHNP